MSQLSEQEIKCPICNTGKLFTFCGMFTCVYCRSMWLEWEFIGACREAGLTVDINDKSINIYREESPNATDRAGD